MANNKVVLSNGTTLMDITDTTATAEDVKQGKNFYLANGEKVAGTFDDDWKIDNCYQLFAKNARFNIYDILMAHVYKPTSTSAMFYDCQYLRSVDLSSVDMSNVTDMTAMFSSCRSLQTLDITTFDTRNVTNMQSMFMNCSSLSSLDTSVLVGNKITSVASMLQGCSSLQNIDVSNLFLNDTNAGGAVTMSGMFQNCTSATNIDCSCNITNQVTNMNYLFYGCSNLINAKIGNNSSNYAAVTNSQYVFYGCTSLERVEIRGMNVLPISSSNAFTNLKADCQIKVPANLVNQYKSATNWSTRADYISALE